MRSIKKFINQMFSRDVKTQQTQQKPCLAQLALSYPKEFGEWV